MDYELRKLLLGENYEVTDLQKQILSIVNDFDKITKDELYSKLRLTKGSFTKYQLEHEIGVLQGKGLLDDHLNIINLEDLDDLIIKSEEPDLAGFRSERRQGFYDGTNTVQQNRKWFRSTINEKRGQLFTLNPDNKFELVVLGHDRSCLNNNRISLANFSETCETFDVALYNLQLWAGNKKHSEEWNTLLAFLTDYIFRTEGFLENFELDESGMHSGRPDTVDDRKLDEYLLDKDKDLKVTISDLLEEEIEEEIDCVPFSTIYNAITDALNTANNCQNQSDSDPDSSDFDIDDEDDYVNNAIYEISSKIVENLVQLLLEENGNTLSKDCIDNMKNTVTCDREDNGIVTMDPVTLFVALWCLYWRVYYKEL